MNQLAFPFIVYFGTLIGAFILWFVFTAIMEVFVKPLAELFTRWNRHRRYAREREKQRTKWVRKESLEEWRRRWDAEEPSRAARCACKIRRQ